LGPARMAMKVGFYLAERVPEMVEEAREKQRS
jgi:hypothetical protein